MTGELTVRFAADYPAEAAELLERATPDAAANVLSSLPPPVATAVLGAMAPGPAADCLVRLTPRAAARLLKTLKLEAVTPLLLRLDARVRNAILRALPATISTSLRIVLQFPSDSLGALLDPQVMTARADAEAGETIALGRRAPQSVRRYLYVLGDEQRLVGVVGARQCALSDPAQPIARLMDPGPVALLVRTRLQEAVHNPHWERFDMLPVVDRRGVFLGVVRRNNLQRAVQGEEASTGRVDVTDLALDLADLWWQTASAFLIDTSKQDEKP